MAIPKLPQRPKPSGKPGSHYKQQPNTGGIELFWKRTTAGNSAFTSYTNLSGLNWSKLIYVATLYRASLWKTALKHEMKPKTAGEPESKAALSTEGLQKEVSAFASQLGLFAGGEGNGFNDADFRPEKATKSIGEH